MVAKFNKHPNNKWTNYLGIAAIALGSVISSGCNMFGDQDEKTTAPIHPKLLHTSSSGQANKVRSASYRPQKSSTQSAPNSETDTIPNASAAGL